LDVVAVHCAVDLGFQVALFLGSLQCGQSLGVPGFIELQELSLASDESEAAFGAA
jgi:hypothetical protein